MQQPVDRALFTALELRSYPDTRCEDCTVQPDVQALAVITLLGSDNVEACWPYTCETA